ncbi:hypothetical protein BH10BAC3_BH10BAC3_13970 [soil metagenome]
MAYEIVRKKRFLTKLIRLIIFLENEWSFSVATNFLKKIDDHTELIANQPLIGTETGVKNVRSVLITKQNRLYYKISDKKVIIMNMYDTRINPNKNPFKKR